MKSIDVCYLNSCSLVNKFAQFQALVYSSCYNIICVTETWLSNYIYDKEILPCKFTIFRKDRESRGGGVLIAVNECLPCNSIPTPPHIEVIAIRVNLPNKEISICTVYNPPNADLNYFSDLVHLLKSLSQKEKNLIVVGDFNLPEICWSSLSGNSLLSNIFCDFVFEYNLSQLIKCPTHVKGNMLDLLLTNNENLVSQLTVNSTPALQLSDHYNICFHIAKYSLTPRRKPILSVFDYSKADYEGLCNYLLDVDYSACLQSNSIEYVWNYLKNIILTGMNKFIPKRKLKYKQHPHWYNSEIFHTINRLRSARKRSQSLKVLILETHLSSLISKAKSNFEDTLSSQPASKIFSYIRSFLPSSSVPPTVSLDSHTSSNNYEKAILFNNFFSSVFTLSSFSIPPLESLPTPASTLSTIGISEMDVYEALSSLDTSKAGGPDGIGAKILKHCASALYSLYHHLFLLCLSHCSLPFEWREHLIVPVFKSGDRSSVKNYRAISLLCTSSKLLEKLIYDKVICFVSSSISHCQFGFRPKHSSTQQLLSFLSTIHESLSTYSQVDAIYLDFRKAFDSVPHNELLVKLWTFGIRGNLWKWMQSYLSHRTQRVLLNHTTSDPLPVLSGVPQGSILGPLLFLIFINDIPLSVRHSNIFLYADDTKCSKGISSESDCTVLQEDLSQLSSWCQKWNLHFNIKKCVLIRYYYHHSSFLHNYDIDNSPIQVLTSHRDLGIVMSGDMTWRNHLNLITARAY